LQIQTQLWEFSLNWTKALFPVSIEPLYTCRTAHIFANTKNVFYILIGTNWFFFRGSIKFLGSGPKFRVGRVSGNTTFFLYGLTLRERKYDLHQASSNNLNQMIWGSFIQVGFFFYFHDKCKEF
jgi:hypothetical protein